MWYMVYGYVRVSTDKQTTENQRFEIEKFTKSRNIRIDKVTVWDGAGSAADGRKSSTANFLSGMVQSLPPLHEVVGMAGIDLPGYLGKVKAAPGDDEKDAAGTAPQAKDGRENASCETAVLHG